MTPSSEPLQAVHVDIFAYSNTPMHWKDSQPAWSFSQWTNIIPYLHSQNPGSGGIRTHAPEETGALIQRLRPLGHATCMPVWIS